jgi:S-adenosylmethionine-diacylgycerolhomoserine-N-methlytransferase
VRPGRPRGAASHADRLEAFYQHQAADYDRFRERLLPGRRELIERLPLAPGAVWVDLGGGTARNLLSASSRLDRLSRVIVIDLCDALLRVAARRVRAHGWPNVDLVRADAGAWPLPAASVDVVTCSYALTMMPGWRDALSAAAAALRPGGTIGVVDFYVSSADRRSGLRTHRWWTRRWWPWWFAHSGVRLEPDHLPSLIARFDPVVIDESVTPLPYLPAARVPYYTFIGRASGTAAARGSASDTD